MAIERTKGTLRCKQKPIASNGRDHIHVSRRKAKEEDRDTKQRVIVICQKHVVQKSTWRTSLWGPRRSGRVSCLVNRGLRDIFVYGQAWEDSFCMSDKRQNIFGGRGLRQSHLIGRLVRLCLLQWHKPGTFFIIIDFAPHKKSSKKV
jgi:hypothetical protein